MVIIRGGSRAAATCKMERFVIIVNRFNCGIIMTATPSTRFSRMNWLYFHHNHCSKLAENTFETILMGDSAVAGLS